MEKAASTNDSLCQGENHLGLGFFWRAAYGPEVLLAVLLAHIPLVAKSGAAMLGLVSTTCSGFIMISHASRSVSLLGNQGWTN